MNIIFLFLAVLAAIVAWWLSQQRISAKPWLETGPIGDTGASSVPAAKIGLGVFLAIVGSLFALLISAYSMRMEMGEWRPAPVPKLLWLNTGAADLEQRCAAMGADCRAPGKDGRRKNRPARRRAFSLLLSWPVSSWHGGSSTPRAII